MMNLVPFEYFLGKRHSLKIREVVQSKQLGFEDSKRLIYCTDWWQSVSYLQDIDLILTLTLILDSPTLVHTWTETDTTVFFQLHSCFKINSKIANLDTAFYDYFCYFSISLYIKEKAKIWIIGNSLYEIKVQRPYF